MSHMPRTMNVYNPGFCTEYFVSVCTIEGVCHMFMYAHTEGTLYTLGAELWF